MGSNQGWGSPAVPSGGFHVSHRRISPRTPTHSGPGDPGWESTAGSTAPYPQWLCDPQNSTQSLGAGAEHPDRWRNTKGTELGELMDPREGPREFSHGWDTKSQRGDAPAEPLSLLKDKGCFPAAGSLLQPKLSQLTLFFHYSRTQLVSLSKSPAKVAGI